MTANGVGRVGGGVAGCKGDDKGSFRTYVKVDIVDPLEKPPWSEIAPYRCPPRAPGSMPRIITHYPSITQSVQLTVNSSGKWASFWSRDPSDC